MSAKSKYKKAMKLNEKKEKRAALVKDMRNVLDANPKGLSADEETKYENMQTELGRLSEDIKREESLAAAENSLKSYVPPAPVTNPTNAKDAEAQKKALYHEGFFNYLRRGEAGFSNGKSGAEFRNALEAGVDSEGGYLVPQEWAASLVKAQGEINAVRKYAKVIATNSDRNIPVRAGRAAFAWIDEEGAYPTPDPSYGNVLLGAHKLGGTILVSDELLADNAYNLDAEIALDAAEEAEFMEEGGFTTGNDTGKPNGLFNVTAVGGTSLTGTPAAGTAVVTADEMIDTYYGLSKRYRNRAVWLTSDAIEKQLRKLKDSDGQYIWQPGLQVGAPDTLLGRPFETSDSAPTPATGVRSIVFGDLSYYTIVDRLKITMKRLNELYAGTGQTGFQFTKRVDGELTLAPAVTFLVQA